MGLPRNDVRVSVVFDFFQHFVEFDREAHVEEPQIGCICIVDHTIIMKKKCFRNGIVGVIMIVVLHHYVRINSRRGYRRSSRTSINDDFAFGSVRSMDSRRLIRIVPALRSTFHIVVHGFINSIRWSSI